MLSATLLLRYAMAVGTGGLGQPFGGGLLVSLLVRPAELVCSDDMPEVMNRRRGDADCRSKGANVWVITWVEVTLML
jgi:hypothetical protein